MPFMPEMFKFCGKRFEVYKRAHKTCDTVFPVRGRRVSQAVHLNTRCDGSALGGCQASCLIFWKEAWLKPVRGTASEQPVPSGGRNNNSDRRECTESSVFNHTQLKSDDGTPSYVCQATRLPYATTHLAWWDIRQYVE